MSDFWLSVKRLFGFGSWRDYEPEEPFTLVWLMIILGALTLAWGQLRSLCFYEAEGILNAATQAEWTARVGFIVGPAFAYFFGRRAGLAEGFRHGKWLAEREGESSD